MPKPSDDSMHAISLRVTGTEYESILAAQQAMEEEYGGEQNSPHRITTTEPETAPFSTVST